MYFLYFYHVCSYLFIYSYHIYLYSYTFLYILLLSDVFILYFMYFFILLPLSCLYYVYHSCTCTYSCAFSSFTYLYRSLHLAFLSFVLSMFHLIPFGMSIIYSYHLRIPIMSLSIHILSIFLSCSIYSFMYDNHMFTSYNLIFICAYHSCTLDYHIL